MVTKTIVPAAAGYLAVWHTPGSWPEYGSSPVVAWMITVDDEGDVFSSDAIIEGSPTQYEAIQCPDGTVSMSDSGMRFGGIAGWLDHARHKHKQEAQAA